MRDKSTEENAEKKSLWPKTLAKRAAGVGMVAAAVAIAGVAEFKREQRQLWMSSEAGALLGENAGAMARLLDENHACQAGLREKWSQDNKMWESKKLAPADEGASEEPLRRAAIECVLASKASPESARLALERSLIEDEIVDKGLADSPFFANAFKAGYAKPAGSSPSGAAILMSNIIGHQGLALSMERKDLLEENDLWAKVAVARAEQALLRERVLVADFKRAWSSYPSIVASQALGANSLESNEKFMREMLAGQIWDQRRPREFFSNVKAVVANANALRERELKQAPLGDLLVEKPEAKELRERRHAWASVSAKGSLITAREKLAPEDEQG